MRTTDEGHHGPTVETDATTGLPLVRLGRRISADDVALAQDDG